MRHKKMLLLFSICMLLLLDIEFGAETYNTLEVDTLKRGIEISPMLYGVFFEDINYAGDGGLYAELIQNRSFEFPNPLYNWSINTLGKDKAGYGIEKNNPISSKNPTYLRIVISSIDKGIIISNQGYHGITVKKGENYIITLYARSPDNSIKNILFEVSDRKGNVGFKGIIEGIGKNWQKYEKIVTCENEIEDGRFVISVNQKGILDLDFISLFPQNTWKGRKNGLRYDLAKLVADLRPSFIRFPGGCLVQGRTMADAYRWKKTIGDPSERPTIPNFWGYYQSLGLGFYEYFLFCEDIGAEPVPVINCGMSFQGSGPNDMVPLDKLDEYIQDALDLIEFANGSVNTKWGAVRAQLGHPEPFNMKYIEIGNEQWGYDYYVRYEKFYDAIKKKYPNMNVIFGVGPSPSGKIFDDGWNWVKSKGKADLVDEHYYMAPEWFLSNTERYANYDKNYKVYVGEYAAHGQGRRNNLESALAEAAYLINIEKYSDVVKMISYAPLFGKEGVSQWQPNLIWFNNKSSYATPNYYVIKMLNENKGRYILPMNLNIPADPSKMNITGMIGLGSWQTAVEYKDLKIIDNNTQNVLYEDNFKDTMKNWIVFRGIWTQRNGVFSQSTLSENCFAVTGNKEWNNYTIQVKAKKNSGREGFLIMFGVKDFDNFYWWNIGGWGNSYTAIEKSVNGIKSIIGSSANIRVIEDRWYDIKIEVNGNRIRCYLDGVLVHDVEDKMEKKEIYANAVEDMNGDVILKVVNISGENKKINILLKGLSNESILPDAEITVLTSDNLKDENSMDNPKKIFPQITTFNGVRNNFVYEFPKYSLTIIRIKKK